MKASASSAITVINAFATGKGGAVGIDLWTRAEVKLTGEGLKGKIVVRGEELTDYRLVNAVVETFRELTGEEFGVKFSVESDIPVGMGLKSSSAAANALSRAITLELGLELDDMEIVRLGVKAARKAGVTLTGAFDDACASYFGSLCLTDNRSDEVLNMTGVEESPVVLLLSERRVLTESLSGRDFSVIAPYVEEAFKLALRGEWKKALVLNGLIYSAYLGYNLEPIKTALELGALPGLSGKGPAFFALTEEPEELAERWSELGRVEITSLR